MPNHARPSLARRPSVRPAGHKPGRINADDEHRASRTTSHPAAAERSFSRYSGSASTYTQTIANSQASGARQKRLRTARSSNIARSRFSAANRACRKGSHARTGISRIPPSTVMKIGRPSVRLAAANSAVGTTSQAKAPAKAPQSERKMVPQPQASGRRRQFRQSPARNSRLSATGELSSGRS